MKLTVFIACFNEKATILKAIAEAKQLDIDKEIIVIDNCSTDGTREILKNLNDNSLRIVLQKKNYGVGCSVALGIKMAEGDYFYSPCADLEYRMSDVLAMIKKLEEESLDVIFGSRLAAKENRSKITIIRERPYYAATIVATYLINKWYGKKFTDIIAPKLIKTRILKEINCKANNQAFEFELVSRLCKKGYNIGEIPIYYKPRSIEEGKTIRPFDFLPALIAMTRVKLFEKA